MKKTLINLNSFFFLPGFVSVAIAHLQFENPVLAKLCIAMVILFGAFEMSFPLIYKLKNWDESAKTMMQLAQNTVRFLLILAFIAFVFWKYGIQDKSYVLAALIVGLYYLVMGNVAQLRN